MGTDDGDATTGEVKRTQRQLGKKKGTQRRGGQKSKGTGRLDAITVTNIGILFMTASKRHAPSLYNTYAK